MWRAAAAAQPASHFRLVLPAREATSQYRSVASSSFRVGLRSAVAVPGSAFPSSFRPGGNFATILETELQQSLSGPLAPLQARWAKKSKRKRKEKMDDMTAERKAIRGGPKERVFDHYTQSPETSFEMRRQIRNHLRSLTSDGRHNIRRKKDFTRYTNYRVLRAAGLTHDDPKVDADRRGFVTPLTKLQDEANLPRSVRHRRFLFPHTLNYQVYWGPPSVYDNPNENEGSMVRCSVAARLEDLPLTHNQKERLVDIVGPNRIDEHTGVLVLDADHFPERNHNAAMLGDMLEKLIREAASVRPPSEEDNS